jgi:hypothetical protein
MDFSYLAQYRAADKTARVTLYSLPAVDGKHPTLVAKFAGPGNDAYINARAKAAWASGLQPSTVRKVNEEIEARLLADAVFTGWEDVYAADEAHPGCVKPAEFSPDACFAYLMAIAEHKNTTFYYLLEQVRTESTFLVGVAAPKVHAEDLGKE